MTTYTCPVHAVEFSDDDLPARVSAVCHVCIKTLDATLAKAQQDYEQRYRAWHAWQRHSGVPVRGRNRTLDNWVPKGMAQEPVAKAVRQFAAGIAANASLGKGLTLLGSPGVGKTHLGYALVSAACAAGLPARYAVWGNVLERGRVTNYGVRDAATQKYLTDLKRAPLLVLDEVGMRTGTDVEQKLLFEIIDTRYGDQRSTVVISNLTEDTLDEIGERVADRLREVNRALTISGDSQRAFAGDNQTLQGAPDALLEPAPPALSLSMCINGEMVQRPLLIRKPELSP